MSTSNEIGIALFNEGYDHALELTYVASCSHEQIGDYALILTD